MNQLAQDLRAAMAPPIGTLTDRVQLQRREDGDGGTTVFVPLATIWARVRSFSSWEKVDPSHSVVIRFRSDVRPGDRFVYRGRLLEVVDPTDLNGRRVYLNCTCRAIASAEASHV